MMMMFKMSLEQVHIIGLEISVLILTLISQLVVLEEYIELWSNMMTIISIGITTFFLLFQKSTIDQPKINFNITL